MKKQTIKKMFIGAMAVGAGVLACGLTTEAATSASFANSKYDYLRYYYGDNYQEQHYMYLVYAIGGESTSGADFSLKYMGQWSVSDFISIDEEGYYYIDYYAIAQVWADSAIDLSNYSKYSDLGVMIEFDNSYYNKANVAWNDCLMYYEYDTSLSETIYYNTNQGSYPTRYDLAYGYSSVTTTTTYLATNYIHPIASPTICGIESFTQKATSSYDSSTTAFTLSTTIDTMNWLYIRCNNKNESTQLHNYAQVSRIYIGYKYDDDGVTSAWFNGMLSRYINKWSLYLTDESASTLASLKATIRELTATNASLVEQNENLSATITSLEENTYSNMLLSICLVPIELMKTIFSFEIFGINLSTAIFSIISLGVILWLIKKL